jgi:glycosyltransferase involved in cell wall biosynthesis
MDNRIPITPVVSVVMPLYNKEREVSRAIDSVLSQTVREFELIVVNDGSTDRGPDVVKASEDQRIRIFDQINQGVSAARNKGIAEAKTDLIAFLDADDEWKPDFLETIVRLKKNFPACSVFATNYLFSLPDGSNRPTILRGLPRDFHEGILPDYFALASKSDPPLWSSAVAVTKTAINSAGGFPVGITSGEDLLTWARLAINFRIAYCKEPKAYFWKPTHIYSRKRVPQVPDIVGQELSRMVANHNSRELYCYASLWHRMRANIYLQLGDGLNATAENRIALRYNKSDWKLYFLYCVARLPQPLAVKLFHQLKRILTILRYPLIKKGNPYDR